VTILTAQSTDVNAELARQAFSGISMTPEERAGQAIQSYVAGMNAVFDEFERWVTDENRDQMAADLQMYRLGYVSRMQAYWVANSRVMSTMIAGPSGFPRTRNAKRCNTSDRRRDEWLDWNKKTLLKLRRKYDPLTIAYAPIRSDDTDAVKKLQAKLEAKIAQQERMKAINRICRKKDLTEDERIEQLFHFDGIGVEVAKSLLEPDWAGKVGLPDYELKNNGAEIRRLRKRIEKLQAEYEVRAQMPDEYEIGCAIVAENAEEERLQIFFDGKPSAEMIKRLKARGFVWSHRNEAWQRLLNNSARQAAREVLK